MHILFITWGRLGDAALSTSLVNYLTELHPGAKFTIAGSPPALDLFSGAPGLEKLIPMVKKPYGMHWFDLWRETAGKKWDMVIDLRRSALSYFLLTKKRYFLGQTNYKNRVHRLVDLAKIFDLIATFPPKIWLTDQAKQAANNLLNKPGPYLAIAPTANWIGKQWAGENFAEAAQRLTAAGGVLAGATIVVFGASQERVAAQACLEALYGLPVIDLIGKTTPLTAAACLARCQLFIGNDSGLMHIAATMEIPTIGLFGPSYPEQYGPFGARTAVVQTPLPPQALVDSIPNYNRHTTGSLMGSIHPDQVIKAANKLLGRAKAAAA